jgi:hypothetical protein
VLDLIVIGAVGMVVVVAVFAVTDHLGPLSDSALVATEKVPTSVPANLATGNPGSALPSGDHQTRQVDPKLAVLSARDLPGYTLISSAEAVRPGGGTLPNSRDNLFQKSVAGSPDYRMTEAIVVVYGVVSDAMTDVELLRQNQESQGVKVSPGRVGSQSMTWTDRTSVPGYTLVHAVFRIGQVVAQVTVLGKDNPMLTDELQVLAAAQQMRLVAPLHDGV